MVKIALIVAPFIAVPPVDYSGTELFVAHLAEGLQKEGISWRCLPMENQRLVLSGGGSTNTRNGQSKCQSMPGFGSLTIIMGGTRRQRAILGESRLDSAIPKRHSTTLTSTSIRR